MPGSEYTHTMVATLGGQPQVVTFTLDLLLRTGFPISEVFVIHPKATDPRLQHSLACLKAQFVNNRYQNDTCTINCHFDSCILHLNGVPQEDIQNEVSAIGAQDTIYHLIRDLKQQRQRVVHLSVTGGRRVMSLLAISAAQLNFKHIDHIWHIYTPEEFRRRANEGAIMHASSEDGVRLIAVPFVPWGAYFPYLPQPHEFHAQEVLNTQVAQMDAQIDAIERTRCRYVLNQLTSRQYEVLKAFARGLTRREVADQLTISIKTVDTFKTVIFDYCRDAWELADDEPRDHSFFKDHFARFLASNEYTPPSRKIHQKGVLKIL